MSAIPNVGSDQPVELAQALIRCASVTPAEGGALGLLEAALEPLGFVCHRLKFSAPGTPDVENLYARLGTGRPNFCFAGHTDVVPVGETADWANDPFSGKIVDGALHGRGAVDMKGAVAAFVSAAARHVRRHGAPESWPHGGSISLLITGDEEGPAVNGTRRVLEWMAERGEIIDACLVGEPTNPDALGDMIKIGRRGSLNGHLTVHGVQGHTAYPHLADNPAHHLVRLLAALTEKPIDDGTEHFQPTTLQISTIDIGNPATNVVPAHARASFNIRFNDLHTSASLTTWLRETLDAVLAAGNEAGTASYELDIWVTGESFLTPPGALSDVIADAVEAVTGKRPELSTTGGTSDARFIKNFCPVAEFGLISQTMHKVDERAACTDIEALADIYERVLDGFFSKTA